MTLRLKIIILVFIQTLMTNAQDSLVKKNLFGFGTGFSYIQTSPTFIKTLNAYYKNPRHQFSLGLDIYSINSPKTFAGFQAGYAFAISEPARYVNAYLAYAFQHVRFGRGTEGYVPYNYLPTDEKISYNMWRTISLTNTLGLRVSFTIARMFSIYTEMGGGCTYSKQTYSPTHKSTELIFFTQTSWVFTPLLKAGLNFKITRW